MSQKRGRRGKSYRGDGWSARARAEGLPARSAFKLREIAERVSLWRGVNTVLDLGAAPGSWSLESQRHLGPGASILGVDLQKISVTAEGLTFLQCPMEDLDEALLLEATGGTAPPFDLLLSDMAPKTTGTPSVDHLAQIGLAEGALYAAQRWLRPGGSFVCKVFDGSDAQAFLDACKNSFQRVRRMRPKAVRGASREFYVVAEGSRPSR